MLLSSSCITINICIHHYVITCYHMITCTDYVMMIHPMYKRVGLQ